MELFSEDYVSARQRFLEAATTAGARLHQLPLAATGAAGEPLQIDIAWLGAAEARRALIYCSGLHGVEGFAGAAIQLQLLRRPPVPAPDCALLLVHILDPFGMSWLRRVNERNVDLNRNFIFPGETRPQPPAEYAHLNRLLNPPYSPRWDGFYLKVLLSVLRYGYAPLKAAVACGQYRFPRGLFYGGTELEEGPKAYQRWLRQQLPSPERLLVIDLHTGLGKPGQESLLQSLATTPESELSRRLAATVTPDQQASQVLGYQTYGGHEQLYRHLYPDCASDFITHEFSTLPALQVLKALRAENQWHHYGSGDLANPAKIGLKRAFCLPEECWRRHIVNRGERLVAEGLTFLATASD